MTRAKAGKGRDAGDVQVKHGRPARKRKAKVAVPTKKRAKVAVPAASEAHPAADGSAPPVDIVIQTPGTETARTPVEEPILRSHIVAARAVLRRHLGGKDHVAFDLGDLHVYEPMTGIWVRRDRSQVERIVHRLDGVEIFNAKGEVVHWFFMRRDVTGIVASIEAETADPGFFDAAAPGLTFQNGYVTVDAHGAYVAPRSPEHRARAVLPYPYLPNAIPVKTIAAFREVFLGDVEVDAKIDRIQEGFGTALCGCSTGLQKALLLYGEGGTGKSTLIDALSDVFPAGSVGAVRPQDLGREYDRARLVELRLNAVAELPALEIEDAEAFKAAITGDQMKARDPYKRVFFFRPTAGHVWAANGLPGVRDFSRGLWRRLTLISFDRMMDQQSGCIVDLGHQLAREEGALIASWLVEGAVRALAQGYTPVPSSDVALAEWRASADSVAMWIEERVLGPATPGTPASLVQRDYKDFCFSQGYKNPVGPPRLKERLGRLGYPEQRTNAARLYPLALKGSTLAGRLTSVGATPAGAGSGGAPGSVVAAGVAATSPAVTNPPNVPRRSRSWVASRHPPARLVVTAVTPTVTERTKLRHR